MEHKTHRMTLHDAFAAHPTDMAWLARNGRYRPEAWDEPLEVWHVVRRDADYYLGTDRETVLQVFGQSEPLLVCDAQVWTWLAQDLGVQMDDAEEEQQ